MKLDTSSGHGKHTTIFVSLRNGTWIWLVSVVIVTLAFAYFNTYVAVNYAEFPRMMDIQNIIQIVQKYDDPALLSRDFAFADNGYKLYVPAYILLIRFIDRFMGSSSYEISIHYLMFPICLLFLLSMTWLLWRITRRRWLSLIMALVSTLSFEIIYGTFTYSVGRDVTPRFVHLAIAPLLFGLLLFYGKDRRWGPLAFLVAGLSSNLQFGSGVGLVFAFGLGWVLHDLFENPTRQQVLHWTLCGLLAILGAVPYVLAFQSGQVVENAVASNVSPEAFNAMLRTRYVFYPMDIYGDLQLKWPAEIVVLVKSFFYVYPLFVVANLLLRRAGRQRAAYFLLYFANLIFAVFVAADESRKIVAAMILPAVLLGISDFILRRELDLTRLMLVYVLPGFAFLGAIFSLGVVDLIHVMGLYMPQWYFDLGIAAKYMAFVLNVYGALIVSECVSAGRFYSRVRGPAWQALALMVVAGCLAYRFWQTPYNGYSYYRSNAKGVVLGQRLFTPSQVEHDYRQATMWIRVNMPKDALFLVLNDVPSRDFMFRYKAQRSMWVSWKDGGISFYKGRDAFVRWYREFEARKQALADCSPKAVMEYASTRRIDYLFIDKQHYGWLVAGGPGMEKVFENESYLVAKILPENSIHARHVAPQVLLGQWGKSSDMKSPTQRI